jgi:hypothetical protein
MMNVSTNARRDTNSPRDHPEGVHIIKSDYYIVRYLDCEVADVFLFPEGFIYDIGDGRHEYDVTAFLLHGVHVWPGLEGFIRDNYQMLCEIGEPLY